MILLETCMGFSEAAPRKFTPTQHPRRLRHVRELSIEPIRRPHGSLTQCDHQECWTKKWHVPSGNLLHSYWKWWFSSWIFPLKMVIFHSYVNVYQRVYKMVPFSALLMKYSHMYILLKSLNSCFLQDIHVNYRQFTTGKEALEQPLYSWKWIEIIIPIRHTLCWKDTK